MASDADMGECDKAEELHAAHRRDAVKYDKAARHAVIHHQDILQILATLQSEGLHLPPERFKDNNAEVWRFANTLGMSAAETPTERSVAEPKACVHL